MILLFSLIACENIGLPKERPETVGMHLCLGTEDPDVVWDFETQEVTLEGELISVTELAEDENHPEFNLVACNARADRMLEIQVLDADENPQIWFVGVGLQEMDVYEPVAFVTPELDLVVGQRLTARFMSVMSWGESQALLISDEEGLVFAADEAAWGAPLGDDPWEGLSLAQGNVEATVDDECGVQDWRERIFEADEDVSVANGQQAEIAIDGAPFTALNAVNYEWAEINCTDLGGSGAWAVWR